MDKLTIHDITFIGYHGALPEENVLGQPFITSLTFELDLRPAGISDDLGATIDYRTAIAVVEQVITGEPVKLIETIAERIVSRLLEELPLAIAVTVRLTKPRPPVPVNFAGATVQIRRERAGK